MQETFEKNTFHSLKSMISFHKNTSNQNFFQMFQKKYQNSCLSSRHYSLSLQHKSTDGLKWSYFSQPFSF